MYASYLYNNRKNDKRKIGAYNTGLKYNGMGTNCTKKTSINAAATSEPGGR